MVFRILVGIFVGVFLIVPIVSGDVNIDLAQITATTQNVVEKVILIIQVITSDGKPMSQGV
jgi:hypothetical protein